MPPKLPEALTDPPWLRKPKRPADWKAVTIAGLEPPPGRRVRWAPGEREDWLGHPVRADEAYWRAEIDRHFGKDRGAAFQQADVLVHAPEHLARPLLPQFAPREDQSLHHWLQPLLARFELDVWDLVVRMAGARPTRNGWPVVPLLGADTARLAAYWLYKLKTARHLAEAWFERHGPLAAGYYLVPDALGAAAAPRRQAVNALRHVAGMDPDLVVRAARRYGEEAAAAVVRMLADAPAGTFAPAVRPTPPPPYPKWADADALPRPVLREDGTALPAAATRNLVHILAMDDGMPDDYPGVGEAVDEVEAICEPPSLAAFTAALFEAWRAAGYPAGGEFVLSALARCGDGAAVGLLGPLLPHWSPDDEWRRVSLGMRVLAAIGGEEAAVHLHDLARSPHRGVRYHAWRHLEAVAADLDLTADRIADRLVPSLGLDASGTLDLDYGPRRFTVGFDEQLRPFVTGEDGRLRKALPKPAARDDPARAAAARERFTALKRDVRGVAREQLDRLEAAMLDGRRWVPADFREHLAGHPLLRHIVRRLVWRIVDGPAFRIAEDGTFAGVDDDAVAVPDAAEIALVHPVTLGADEAGAWAALLADYEILQPFPQLGRPVVALTGAERESDRLARLEGAVLPAAAVRALLRGGWRWPPEYQGPTRTRLWRAFGDHRYLVVDFAPGLRDADPERDEAQTIRGVRGTTDSRADPGDARYRLGDLDPVALSEALTALLARIG
ncbi:DUF4132 domain-containing protein [Actinomadura sp. WMMB 499]|uniref:DUF4132 domain-containing protein n=1 Tax=Actinomadura sp. WMMB 499 TaxID=1219491 RepID=UPI0012493D53|nr:DUF4132 domain-containing protein [Actinomadura sp. WMMB 499]QFG20439.1 DUF4132 domain-containing protein [Actinomadura sp. WMMB 499]